MLYLTPVLTEESIEKAKTDPRESVRSERELLKFLAEGEKDPAELFGEILEVDALVDRDGNSYRDLNFVVELTFRRDGHLYGVAESVAVDLTALAEVSQEMIDTLLPARPRLFTVSPV